MEDADDNSLMIEDNANSGEEEVRLTKHLNMVRELPPLYTGGSFHIMRNERHCLAMRDSKICVFDREKSKVLTTIAQENEEIICFAVSPNQQLLALSNKNYMIRVFALPDELSLDSMQGKPINLEQLKQFKTTGQMVLELAFDPSSKFLAAGTADSQIKVFDAAKGF